MDDQAAKPTMGRRNLLRGGAAVATVAGLGVGAVFAATPASAAPVNYVELGEDNAETTSTSITVNGTTGDEETATLSLTNVNGPSLKLNTLTDDWAGDLQPGEIANVGSGPLVGLADGTTTFLATGMDLLSLPVTIPVLPERMVDLRTAGGRQSIVGSSANAFDTRHRLKAGAYMDIAFGDASGALNLTGIFGNLTVTGATTGGWLTVYPPLAKAPNASNLNFGTGQTVANLVFAALEADSSGRFVTRITTTGTTWVILDITGVVAQINLDAVGPDARSRQSGRRSANDWSGKATHMLKAAGAED